MSLTCHPSGGVSFRSALFGGPGLSPHLTQDLQIKTENWTSETLSLSGSEDGEAYEIALDPSGQVVSAMRFSSAVTIFPEGREAFGFEISLDGFAAALDAVIADCGAAPAEDPQPLSTEALPKREFDEADKIAATSIIVSANCSPGNPAAYCADPDVLALRGQQIEAAAAAIARGLDPRRRDVLGNERPALLNALVRCSNDAACLQEFLTQRIAFWDALYRPLGEDTPEGLDAAMTEACRAALSPSSQLACTDPTLAKAEAALRRQLRAVREDTAGTPLANLATGSPDEVIAGIHEGCPADVECLRRRYEALAAELDGITEELTVWKAKKAEEERQLAQAEAAAAARRKAETEARRAAEEAARTAIFITPPGKDGEWVRQIGLGRFEIARGATRNEQEVMAYMDRKLRLLAFFYHDIYDGICKVDGPSRVFTLRVDTVTTRGGIEVNRDAGETSSVTVRSQYADVFNSGFQLASNPAALLLSTGANFGALFSELVTTSRDVIHANGCGSAELDIFERNLAAIVRGEPSLQRRGEAMTLMEKACIDSDLAGMARRSPKPASEVCGCVASALWTALPEERMAPVEDRFNRQSLLLATALTPEAWEGVQACVR